MEPETEIDAAGILDGSFLIPFPPKPARTSDPSNAWASRDYVAELSCHPNFSELMKEVYDCQLLCNPWLAARVAAQGPKTSNAEPTSTHKVAAAVESSLSTCESMSEDEDAGFFARMYGAPWPDFDGLCRAIQSTLVPEEGWGGRCKASFELADPRLDIILDMLLLKFRRLKHQVLDINSMEAQFRKGYQTE